MTNDNEDILKPTVNKKIAVNIALISKKLNEYRKSPKNLVQILNDAEVP